MSEPTVCDEEARLRRLRLLVDATAQLLANDENLILCEALRLIEAARVASLRLFPDRGSTFDLVVRAHRLRSLRHLVPRSGQLSGRRHQRGPAVPAYSG